MATDPLEAWYIVDDLEEPEIKLLKVQRTAKQLKVVVGIEAVRYKKRYTPEEWDRLPVGSTRSEALRRWIAKQGIRRTNLETEIADIDTELHKMMNKYHDLL